MSTVLVAFIQLLILDWQTATSLLKYIRIFDIMQNLGFCGTA
jgi:hypothetical protein